MTFFHLGRISGVGENGAFDVCVYMDAGGDNPTPLFARDVV